LFQSGKAIIKLGFLCSWFRKTKTKTILQKSMVVVLSVLPKSEYTLSEVFSGSVTACHGSGTAHLMAELEAFLYQMDELGLLSFCFSLVIPLFSPQHLHVHLELHVAAGHGQLCCPWDSLGTRQGRLSPRWGTDMLCGVL